MTSDFELSYSTILGVEEIAGYVLCAQSIEEPSVLFKGPVEKLHALEDRLASIGLTSIQLQDATGDLPPNPIVVDVDIEAVRKLQLQPVP